MNGVGEEIIGAGGVSELFGEAALGGRGLEFVFVLGEIFGHGDELAADVVPGVEQDFGRRVGGLGRSVVGALRGRGKSESGGKREDGQKGILGHRILSGGLVKAL